VGGSTVHGASGDLRIPWRVSLEAKGVCVQCWHLRTERERTEATRRAQQVSSVTVDASRLALDAICQGHSKVSGSIRFTVYIKAVVCSGAKEGSEEGGGAYIQRSNTISISNES
jgi:hypothetical protein